MLHKDQFGSRVTSIRLCMPRIYMFMNTSWVYLLVPFFRLYHAHFMNEETKRAASSSSNNSFYKGDVPNIFFWGAVFELMVKKPKPFWKEPGV